MASAYLCAQLTRDLLAIAKFLFSVGVFFPGSRVVSGNRLGELCWDCRRNRRRQACLAARVNDQDDRPNGLLTTMTMTHNGHVSHSKAAVSRSASSTTS